VLVTHPHTEQSQHCLASLAACARGLSPTTDSYVIDAVNFNLKTEVTES